MGEEETMERRGETRAISVAPMMECTDRHFRYFMRLITRRSLLYTEMVTAAALVHAKKKRGFLLDFSPEERPLALQLGGDDVEQMGECARMAEDWGYDEVNLNVGCPSDRVQRGRFGACLMAEPGHVARMVERMRGVTSLPVTVKHRIGIDDRDRYEDMADFVRVVSGAGADRFSVHARKAWLKGLSPKENREIPPLRYEEVYRLQEEFPGLVIEINGGVRSLEEAEGHLGRVRAVMIGRAAYEDPYMFSGVDGRFFGEEGEVRTREEVVEAFVPYVERHIAGGGRLHHASRHIFGLFAGRVGARVWKRHITLRAVEAGAGGEVLREALALVKGQEEAQRAWGERARAEREGLEGAEGLGGGLRAAREGLEGVEEVR